MESDDTGPADPLDRGNERIREAAKWLVASAAAVGAVMLAGSQLSRIGELSVGTPNTIDNARLWIALVGAIFGLGAVVYTIWSAVRILLPQLVLVGDLSKAWKRPPRHLAPVVAHFKRNIKYLQGFATPAEIINQRDALIAKRADASEIADLDERITAIEDTANHEALKAQFAHTLRRLMSATVVAAIGIVAFAWAANPPKKTPVADLRHSRFVGATMRDADLRNARLDNADFTGADLTGADLTGASIAGVVWRNTICPDGKNSNDDRSTCAGHLS